MRVVIDTNDFISALIGRKYRLKLERVLLNEDIEILADLNLIAEIEQVAKRKKFRKYVTLAQIDGCIYCFTKNTVYNNYYKKQ